MMLTMLAVMCPRIKSTCSMPIHTETCAKVKFKEILETAKLRYTWATSIAHVINNVNNFPQVNVNLT